jgi:hypothetical protein
VFGKRQIGSFIRRWDDNIKMNLRETVWGGVNWIHLVYERAGLRIPSTDGNFLCDELLEDLRLSHRWL